MLCFPAASPTRSSTAGAGAGALLCVSQQDARGGPYVAPRFSVPPQLAAVPPHRLQFP